MLWRSRLARLGLVMGLAAASSTAAAQAVLNSGSVLGRVTDPEGRQLDEIHITLEGPDGARQERTDGDGRFRFDRLEPGSYSIRVEGEGYSSAVYEPVQIRLGRATTVRVQLSQAVGETIVVTSEPPPAEMALGGRHRLSGHEVEQVAAGRDPFAALSRLPGVQTDQAERLGTGDARLAGPGSSARQSSYRVDGVPVGRPPALPAAGVEVAVGGSDASVDGPGMVVNLVSPRLAGARRGGVEMSMADRGWQSSPEPPELADDFAEPQASRTLDVLSYGGDAGVGLFDGRLHLWASHQRREIDRQEVGGQVRSSRLADTALKLQGQPWGTTSMVLGAHRGEHDRRGEGAGADRAVETTRVGLEPAEWARLEVQQGLGPDALLHVHAAVSESAASLRPLAEGGDAVLGSDGVWQGGYADFRFLQDTSTWQLGYELYRHNRAGEHQIEIGVRNHQVDTSESERWGEDNLVILAGENFGTPFDLLRVRRSGDLRVGRTFTSVWAQDSLSISRGGDWTVEYGLRYDVQRGHNRSGSVESNALFPDLLPGLTYDGKDSEVMWNDLSPRLGVAYAPGNARQIIVRASYASFASRLHEDLVGRTSPLAGSEVLMGFQDLNLDDAYDPAEPYFVLHRLGVDESVPGSVTHPNSTSRSLGAERTDELRLGLELHPWRTAEVRLDYVRRRMSNLLESRRLVRDASGRVRVARAWDYELETVYSGLLPDGTPFAAPVYGLVDGLEATGGRLLANGDRDQEYEALTLSFSRRLSRGWLLRSHVSVNDWRWQVGRGFAEFDDPTNEAPGEGVDAGLDPADDDGDRVVQAADRQYLGGRWSFDVYALRQVAPRRPWGFDAALSVHGREGYPVPYTVVVPTSDGLRQLQATPKVDSYRLDDVYTVDLRLQKELRLGGLRATVSFDGLNLLNAGYVLERDNALGSPQADAVRRTLSPRVFQLGLRLAIE